MALYTSTFLGLAPIGALAAGALAGLIGAEATVAACGLASVLAGLAIRIPASETTRPDGR